MLRVMSNLRPLAVLLIVALLLVQPGCGDKKTGKPAEQAMSAKPPAKPADKAPAAQPTPKPSPQANAQTPPKVSDENGEKVIDKTADPDPPRVRANHFKPSDINAKPRLAKRSVFPEKGESFDQLIPAKVLSDEDQFIEPVDPKDIPDVVAWDQAHKYVGYEITVEGTIVNLGQSRDGKVNFLNFHEEWRGKFYMVIFDDLAKTIDGGVTAKFKGKTVRVKGKVEEHKGRPQIKIESMDQVTFVQK